MRRMRRLKNMENRRKKKRKRNETELKKNVSKRKYVWVV